MKAVKSLLLQAFCATGAALAISWSLSDAAAQTRIERSNRGLVELIAGPDDTSLQMAQDLASVLDDGATRRVLPVVGHGSVDNLVDVQLLRGIDMGIFQTDALEAAKEQGRFELANSITYIAKLYNEELHVLAPAKIEDIAQLEGKPVNFAGAAVTGPMVFNLLKIKVEPTYDDPAKAVQQLKSGQLAALVYVAGKPASFFRGLEGMHFLTVPLNREMVSTYLPAQLTAQDYPKLVDANAPVDTVAVGVVLAAAAFQPGSERYRNVANFVDAFFTQFPRLQESGRHSKWKEVNLAADLPGWRRFPAAETWLRRNAVASAAPEEKEVREAFDKFLDERSRLTAGRAMSAAEKNKILNLFLQFQRSQKH